MSRSRLTTLLSTGWLLVGFLALSAAPSDSVLYPSGARRAVQQNLRAFFPEGFGFFTRSPRDPTLQMLRWTDEGWAVVTLSNTDPRNLLGLAKWPRIESMELAALAAALPDSTWQHCRSDPSSWSRSYLVPAVAVHSNALKPRLTGDFILQLIQPAPWAWSALPTAPVMESRVVRVRVDRES